MDTAGLIGCAHANKIGGHVRNHKVELSTFQGILESPKHGLFPEIPANDRNSRYRRDFQKIDRDHATGPPDALDERLRPTARRSAEIDDGIAGMHQPVPLQELEQL